jgi:ABC-type multidrug transport system fused ATPase/permease subunit
LLVAVVKTFKNRWLFSLFLQTIYGLLSFVNAIIIPYMVDYIADKTIPKWWGFFYTGIVLVVTIIASFCYYQSWFISATVGIQVSFSLIIISNVFFIKLRSILIQEVYRKVLNVAPSRTSNSGQVVNLLANDAQFVADTMPAFSAGLTAPIQIIAAIGLLAWHIGAYALLTPAVVVILFPITQILGKRFGTFRIKIQGAADKRLKLTNELVNGIRIVKYYAWENAFVKNIFSSRETELKHLKGLAINRAVLIFVMSNITTLIISMYFIFFTYVFNILL